MIQQYDHLDLYVTWAKVQEHFRDGVAAYLADTWKPIVGIHDILKLPSDSSELAVVVIGNLIDRADLEQEAT